MSSTEFREFLDGATGTLHESPVTVDTTEYVASNLKEPRGTGAWMFGISRSPDLSRNKQNIEWFSATYGSYASAKKQAKKWANEMNVRTIYTLS